MGNLAAGVLEISVPTSFWTPYLLYTDRLLSLEKSAESRCAMQFQLKEDFHIAMKIYHYRIRLAILGDLLVFDWM
jgi:hypothetical protein